MSRKRATWLAALSVLPALSLGVAVWASLVFVVHGSGAEFWVPPIRSDSDSAPALGAALFYLAAAVIGFLAAIAISKGADRVRTEDTASAD